MKRMILAVLIVAGLTCTAQKATEKEQFKDLLWFIIKSLINSER